jgi:hypothetical protein
MQVKASLHRLQAVVEGQDISGLVLLLKELVPDYNPGAELLNTALSVKPHGAAPDKFPVHRAESETLAVTRLKPAALLN